MTSAKAGKSADRKRVGVLGGGQLGRMMGLAGIPLGLDFVFLDPSEDAGAGRLGEMIVADYADASAACELASRTDVVTFDFENIPQDTAEAVQKLALFYPPPDALGACQDRLTEKGILEALGIGVAEHHAVTSRTDLLEGLDRLSYPAVLKTRRLGYDGKGQMLIRGQEDLERAWQLLGDHDLILEAFVPFEAECSLIAVRGIDGVTAFWPLTRNVHRNGILTLSLPAQLDHNLQLKAQDMMQRLFDRFDYVGVMTIEFFLLNGELLVNEIAPRVHNSGHWTIEGAQTSQFENHIRAISGMPLGSTDRNGHSLMFNLIGQLPVRDRLLAIPGLHWHDYGKAARPGRKVGHLTVTTSSQEELVVLARRVADELGEGFPELLGQFPGFRR
jgi:5-(carboxyamino)imidazole ribonucleotide synthase